MTEFLKTNFARIVLFVSVSLLVLGLGKQSQVAAAPLAASAGPNFAGTASNTTWLNQSNATGVDDNNCASGIASESIDLTNFSFSIPAGSMITGILVEPKAGVSGAFSLNAILLKGGTAVGATKSFSPPNTVTCSLTTFSLAGGAGDLWGTNWATSDINAANFGVRINITVAPEAILDAVRITIFFEPPAPPPAPAAPKEVPEGDTLLLFGGGIGGLVTWVGWQWRRARGKK